MILVLEDRFHHVEACIAITSASIEKVFSKLAEQSENIELRAVWMHSFDGFTR